MNSNNYNISTIILRVSTSLYILFISQSVFANEPFWKLASEGMTRASGPVIAAVVFVFVVLIAFLIAIYIHSEKQMEKRKIDVNKRKFNNFCEEFGITKNEREFINNVIEKCKIDNIDSIFLELPFFEIKVDEYIKITYNSLVKEFWQKYIKNSSLKEVNDINTKIINNLREKLDFAFKVQRMPIVTTRQINLGQRLYIRTDTVAKGVETSVRENNIFYIMAIKSGEQAFSFNVGDEVDVFFDRDGQYKFTTTIVESNEAGFSLLHSENLTRTQFRNDVRFELRLPSTFKILHRRDATEKLYCKENDGIILDISGGGIKFSTKTEVLVNDELMFKATWDELQFKFKVKVLRTNLVETKKEMIYMGFSQYSDIDKLVKEKIIRKIFESIRNELKTNY